MIAFGTGALALPTGGAVTAGSASIAAVPGKTTITQTSQNTAINWQGFSIGAAEAVQFVQPGASSVALNRVLGADPSNILGSLSANGRVFLVNPNGILFGSGAQVNVGGLIASTRNISDADFMAGRYKFEGTGNGSVRNQGSINADGGYVALLGASVSNDGVISARLGSVVLAAGNAMTLDVAGDGLLSVAVSEGAVNALARNGGLIRADGGLVTMTAQSAGGLFQEVVNNTGVIQALSIDTRNGSIRLLGDMQSGTVSVSGTLDASGTGAGQTGGSVVVAGYHVGLFDGHINASGDAGGGTVLIGGGYQGGNAGVPNASATYMSAASTIRADAITNGNGGTVVVWANDSTRAYGSISARGGAQGGDGGLIETSGHWLDVTGIDINASAAKGAGGTWLLDPADVTIGAGTTGGTFIANVFTPNSGVNTATVDVGALRTALEAGGGTNVAITTTNAGAQGTGFGDINVNSALTWTPTNPATLTLTAARDVNINAAISTTRGNLVVCCGRDVNVNAPVTTTNGSVLLSGGRNVNLVRSNLTAVTSTAGITLTDGNLTMCAGNDVILSNTFNAAPLITLTRGSTTAGENLATSGVALGLVLSAGTASTGPGAANGTVTFTGGTFATVTGPNAPITINYNPTSYLTPTNYTGNFTGTGGPISARMLVYPDGADKAFDGSTAAVFTALKGTPAGVTLVAGPGATTATFDTADVGVNKTITYTGFTLAGPGVNSFVLPANCCGPIIGRTTGTIRPAVLAVPVVVPPVEVAPVVVAPVVAPVVVAPVVVAPVAVAPVVAPVVVAPVVVAPGVVAPVIVAPGVVAPVVVAPGVEAPVVVAPVVVVEAPHLLPEAAEVGGLLPGFVMVNSAPFLTHLPTANLTVVGVNIPPSFVAQAVAPPVQVQPVAVPPPPVVAPPPPPYVPPVMPPRKDRN